MDHSETLGVGRDSFRQGRAPWEKFLGDLREWIVSPGFQIAARSLPSVGEALGAMPGPTPNAPTHQLQCVEIKWRNTEDSPGTGYVNNTGCYLPPTLLHNHRSANAKGAALATQTGCGEKNWADLK